MTSLVRGTPSPHSTPPPQGGRERKGGGELARSYTFCERLARREAGNFYHAFRLLPAEQRRAMSALYSFMRVTDDLADGPGSPEEKRGPLQDWRRRLDACLEGAYSHPLHPAFHDAMRRFGVPRETIHAVIDGVEMDLTIVHYDAFSDLYPYCYRVASAVGLACIHIWGFTGEQAKVHAEAAGIAFQMTNILRDLGEDAGRGRVYLPREDLERFGYTEDALRNGVRDDRFRALMRFEVERAAAYYRAAEPLAAMLRPAGRAVFLTMLRTYRGLLDAIVRRDYDVFSSRIGLSRWHKLWLAARALPLSWGWA
jgi:15-cis-phytoene synthase